MAQWSLEPREALMVTCEPPPVWVAPAPISSPAPASRFHCSVAGEETDTDVHVSQEKTANTRSFVAEGTVTLATLLVALFPAKLPKGVAWSTLLNVITPTTEYCSKSALKVITTS